jgi:cytochrome c
MRDANFGSAIPLVNPPERGFPPNFVRCTVASSCGRRRVNLFVRAGLQIALVATNQLASFEAAGFDLAAAENLARHSGCNKCHAVEKKKDGPALRDVAAKYRGDDQAEGKLIKHVTSGEMVKFDDGHKEEHKKVKTQDLEQTKNLIHWILSLEGGTKY